MHLGDPHGEGWEEGGETGDSDTNLDYLPTFRSLVVVSQRIFQRQQTVQVDEDKVVDGGAEQDNLHGGHQVTHGGSEAPEADHVRVDGDHDADNEIYDGQRDDHQAESLHKSNNSKSDFLTKYPTCLRHFLDVRIIIISKILARIIKPAMTFFREFLQHQYLSMTNLTND